jgi:ATP-dependent exoDNAse (exonuclease V) beta subunit
LHDLAAELDGQHDLLTPRTVWQAPAGESPLGAARAAGRRLAKLIASGWAERIKAGRSDPLVGVLERLGPGVERLLQAAKDEQALLALLELEHLRTTVGNTGNWEKLSDGRNACTAIKAELATARAEIRQALENSRQRVFAEVLALLRDFVLEGVAARKREGTAGFQDLLAWARDLLRDNPGVRRRAQRRYRRIFVDEFQDTDPLQAEIVFYLAAAPDEPLPPDWRDIRLAAGKLFVVGDPKQSIYRFRRADIAIYDGLLRRLAENREQLVQNFRSLRPVIEWVNHHFEHCMAEREGLQPGYAPLAARWERFEGGDRCGLYRVGADLGPTSAATVARIEAEQLARVARWAIGRLAVSETLADGGRRTRPARARDIAILLRSRTHLRRLERALEQAGVPYRLESGRLMLQTQEVRDLLACLRAIDDPSDQVALVGALRSPAYACSDPDLLRWMEGGGRLSHESPGNGPDGPVKLALASLAGFYQRRQLLSPPALVEAFIGERLLVAAALGEPRPREAWRRLRYVVSRARAFTVAGRHSLRAFLDWIDDLERAEARDAESAELEPDEDAVRILTIHGAKGLEFPIVLLAGLGAAGGGRSGGVEVIADRQGGGLACRAGQTWRSADFETAQAREQEMAEAEAIRLLYVAATRARDHLILSLHRGDRGSRSPAALIEQRLAAFPGDCFEIDLDGEEPVGLSAQPGPAEQSTTSFIECTPEQEAAWLGRRAELTERLAGPATIGWSEPGIDGLDPSAGRQRELGRAVRGLLRWGLEEGAEVDPAALELARAIQADPVYQQAVASPSCRREVSLLATVDGALVDLTIDLLYETAEGMVLVLYGVDGSVGAEAAASSGLVGRAFEAVTGRGVRRVEVIGLDGRSGESAQ